MKMNKERCIAILGATSHIAKNLVTRFASEDVLFLYCRNPLAMQEFLLRENPHANVSVLPYTSFGEAKCEAVINCVGIADPKKQRSNPYDSFIVTERFDNMAIEYLMKNSNTKYINISSGAVFGTYFPEPITEQSTAIFSPNEFGAADWYRVAKLNAEAKHRCLAHLPIVDIRVFSFFSKYVDLDAGYMMCEIARCLLAGTPFKTNASNIIRDYIAPRDLFCLVDLILAAPLKNAVIDAESAKPARKFEIIESLKYKFGLETEIVEAKAHTVSGEKSKYYSASMKSSRLFQFEAKLSSMESLLEEISEIMLTRQ